MFTVPEIATQLVNKSILQPDEDQSRTLFLVGSKSVGKSTLLHSFLEKSDPVRETAVLEYSFGRKSTQKQSLVKTVCHIWEYGGKLEMLKNVLVSIPIQGKTFFCIIIDLSKIKRIWNTIEICVQALSEVKDSTMDLIIVGGKYDIYKNYDIETKKLINNTIRSVALIYEAYVIYYSFNDPHQLRKAKEMLFNIGFGNEIPFKEKNTNNTKPLLIPKKSDSWENIGIPASSIEQVRTRHMAGIQTDTVVQETVKFELQHPQPEPILDSLMSVKYQELSNLETFETSIKDYLGFMHHHNKLL